MVYILHKVQEGETVESIAQRYNIPPCTLPADVRVGNTLKLAVRGGTVRHERTVLDYIIKPAETLETIAKRFAVTPESILRENPDIHPYVGERIKIYK